MNDQEAKVQIYMRENNYSGVINILSDKDGDIHQLKSEISDPRYKGLRNNESV